MLMPPTADSVMRNYVHGHITSMKTLLPSATNGKKKINKKNKLYRIPLINDCLVADCSFSYAAWATHEEEMMSVVKAFLKV